MAPLERYIVAQVFTRLDSPELPAQLAAEKESGEDRRGELRTQIAASKAALTSLEDEKDDGLIDDASYRRRRLRISDRLQEAETQLTALRQSGRRKSLPTSEELRERWDVEDNEWRRTVISSVIERIEIGPHPRGVTSAPPRRRGESEEAWRARFDLHRAKVLKERVNVVWWH